ncbi:MAG: beta-lactamase family protein [Spirochaetota bacterium]|nr:beta-lactamase family protein [Spirochaetota bacterium]
MMKNIDSLIYSSTPSINFHDGKINYFYELVKKSIQDELFPGLEIMVFQGKMILLHKVFGNKRLKPAIEELTLNSIFDVASMTKPMVTALLVMILLEQGKLNLSDCVSSYFPEFNNNEKKDITIKHLLTHSSGLPAWANLYENMKSKDDAINKLLTLPLEYYPGSQMIYSCMGFILLKLIIEKITSTSIDKLAKEYIFTPLEMNNSCFNPSNELLTNIVPSGYCSYRGKIVWGEVHDENSYYFGGLGGNAGLFTTAYDIAILSNMLFQKGKWNGNTIISPQSVYLMIQNHNFNLPPRGLGFNLKDKDYKPCGELFGEHSFGHSGFTGTSFWLDPESLIGIILLSNRVHIKYNETVEAIKTFRMCAHNILLSALKI